MHVYIEETILLAVMRDDEETAAEKLREMNRTELREFRLSLGRLIHLVYLEEDRQNDDRRSPSPST